jgi:hypothetical protein
MDFCQALIVGQKQSGFPLDSHSELKAHRSIQLVSVEKKENYSPGAERTNGSWNFFSWNLFTPC